MLTCTWNLGHTFQTFVTHHAVSADQGCPRVRSVRCKRMLSFSALCIQAENAHFNNIKCVYWISNNKIRPFVEKVLLCLHEHLNNPVTTSLTPDKAGMLRPSLRGLSGMGAIKLGGWRSSEERGVSVCLAFELKYQHASPDTTFKSNCSNERFTNCTTDYLPTTTKRARAE